MRAFQRLWSICFDFRLTKDNLRTSRISAYHCSRIRYSFVSTDVSLVKRSTRRIQTTYQSSDQSYHTKESHCRQARTKGMRVRTQVLFKKGRHHVLGPITSTASFLFERINCFTRLPPFYPVLFKHIRSTTFWPALCQPLATMVLTEVSETDIRRNGQPRSPEGKIAVAMERTLGPNSAAANVGTTAVQSMLKTGTELGDLGLYPANPPIHLMRTNSRMPRRRSGSFDVPSNARLEQNMVFKVPRRPRPRPTFNGMARHDTIGSTHSNLTSYSNGHRRHPRHFPGPAEPFYRRSLGQGPRSLQSHRSTITLRSYDGPLASRSQSPLAFPATLSRMSHRAVSPALSDTRSAYGRAASVISSPPSFFHTQTYNPQYSRSVSSSRRSPSPALTTQYFDYTESFLEEEDEQEYGQDQAMMPLPFTIEATIHEHEPPPIIRQAQTPFGTVPGSMFVPSELPTGANRRSSEESPPKHQPVKHSGSLDENHVEEPVVILTSTPQSEEIDETVTQTSTENCVQDKSSDGNGESQGDSVEVVLEPGTYCNAAILATARASSSSSPLNSSSSKPSCSSHEILCLKPLVRSSTLQSTELEDFAMNMFNDQDGHSKLLRGSRRLSKSLSMDSPRSLDPTDWKLPSLNFRPLTFSSLPRLDNDGLRSSISIVRSEPSEILSPTPERPISAQRIREKFGRILYIDENRSTTGTSSDIAGKSKGPSRKNSTTAYGRDSPFRSTFPPIRERESTAESLLDRLSHIGGDLRLSSASYHDKSTVELLLEKHIQALGLQPAGSDLLTADHDRPKVETEARPSPKEMGRVGEATMTSHSTGSFEHTEREYVRSTRLLQAPEPVPKRLSSLGGTLKLQDYLDAGRPASWLTLESSSRFFKELTAGLGLDSAGRPLVPRDMSNGKLWTSAEKKQTCVRGKSLPPALATSQLELGQGRVRVRGGIQIMQHSKSSTGSIHRAKRDIVMAGSKRLYSSVRRPKTNSKLWMYRASPRTDGDSSFVSRLTVSMDTERPSMLDVQRLPRKSFGDQPSSDEFFFDRRQRPRSFALPLPSSPMILRKKTSTNAFGSPRLNIISFKRPHGSPSAIKASESPYTQPQLPTPDLGARIMQSTMNITVYPPPRSSSIQPSLRHARSLITNSSSPLLPEESSTMRQRLRKVASKVTLPSRAKSMDSLRGRDQNIVELCGPAGPPINENHDYTGTIGISEFAYKKRQLFERIRDWWRKHASGKVLRLKNKRSRRKVHSPSDIHDGGVIC